MIQRDFVPVLLVAIVANCSGVASELFDLDSIRDPDALVSETIKDWHHVDGVLPTRQKVISMLVHDLIPGSPYRIPVRLIVPENTRAKGFHLTGGHRLEDFSREVRLSETDRQLLRRGIGRVQTMVQVLQQSEQGDLGAKLDAEFIRTLDPKYSIQYYSWPLTLMKAITAAMKEESYFERGKIAMSGGSKNGATPSLVLNVDDRTTAVHGTVSPIWDSPLRLCNEEAWENLRSHELEVGQGNRMHPFLGGTFGPIYNRKALSAGHSWESLQGLAERMADLAFVSRNLDSLSARGAEMMFHPGTHDFVCFDLAWGGLHHPDIPLYLEANSGHGIRPPHPMAERKDDNLEAFLFQHFFDDFEGRLPTPIVRSERKDDRLLVSVEFPVGAGAENGRIWWIYDRGPDGSHAYLEGRIPDEQSKSMKRSADSNTWMAEIPLAPGYKRIDFFSNHQKSLSYQDQVLETVISSPYQRVDLD